VLTAIAGASHARTAVMIRESSRDRTIRGVSQRKRVIWDYAEGVGSS